MAKNRIKGITIEIDADVSGVNQSFKELDQSLKDTQYYLKDVNKLLKLDPTNTTLLKQKQEYLNTAIKDTQTRLKALKDTYKNLDGSESEEARQKQLALDREIAETEQNLKSLKEEMRDFGSVANQQLQVAGEKVKEFGDKLTNIGSQMTAKVTAPVVAGFTLALNAASDYEENLNKLEVAFGDYADEVRDFTDNAQMDYGLSKKDASDSAAAFGALAKGIGFAEQESASMAVELTKLSSDLASYFNTDIEDAAGALEGIFTGNAQSLKRFGVVMTDVNLKEFALELGMTAKQYANLGAEDKAMLRFQYVMSQTADAQGDFARTNDGTANSLKSLSASVEDLTTAIGEQLIPIVVPIIQKITEFISKLSQLDEGTLDMIVKIGLIAAALGPILMIVGTIVKSFGSLIQLMGFFTTPVGLVVAAIGLLVAAGVALYRNWDTIKEKLTQLWENVKTVWQQIKDFVSEKVDALVQKFVSFRDTIANAFDFSNIKEKVRGLFDTVGGLFSSSGFMSGGFGSFSSGGFMSGGMTINNNFTINGIEQLSQSRLIEVADVITDRVNENLGRMYA